VVELEDGKKQVQGKSGIGLKLFMKGEEHLLFADARDLSAVKETTDDNIEDLTGFCAKDTSEMGGLISGQSGGGSGPCVCDPAAASHDWAKVKLWSL
jgi:hypothetical protein